MSQDLTKHNTIGFTLIEISIVLVIIGLISGAILVGRDLISAASVRAQISQIDKYQVAVRAFQGKYGYLPGDIPDPVASQFGFLPRDTTYQGGGDGNGVIENYNSGGSSCAELAVTVPYDMCGSYGLAGELILFWADLSKAGLIEGSFSQASATTYNNGDPIADISDPTKMIYYFPEAKIGSGFVVINSGGIEYVRSGGGIATGVYSPASNGKNYFSTLSMDNIINNPVTVSLGGSLLTPHQAYSIDNKIDDGLPQYGKVMAMSGGFWATGTSSLTYGAGASGSLPVKDSDLIRTAAQTYTCYDNGYTMRKVETYSLGAISVNNHNCSLSWEFQ